MTGSARENGTAQVAARLLAVIDGMAAERALTLESMAYAMLQAGAAHRGWLAARGETAPAAAGRLLVERADAVLTLDRPGARNAIDVALRDALVEALAVAEADSAIALIRLRATDAAFSIGGGLAEFGTTRDPVAAHLIRMATLRVRSCGGACGWRCMCRARASARGWRSPPSPTG